MLEKEIKDKTFIVLGRHGFIGSGLAARIEECGGQVTSTPVPYAVAALHFASPTHTTFEKNPDYHTKEIFSSFLYMFSFCGEHNIPFIWPSSALVYEKDTQFAKVKSFLESLQFAYSDTKSLALRIFPVYGPDEGGRGHPTAIYQWCEQMVRGERPVVYGDGKQARDFIYVDDVVDNILRFWQSGKTGIADVGTGKKTSFNEIIATINSVLKTQIEPIYVARPEGYSDGIVCQHPVPVKTDLPHGVEKIISKITGRGVSK